MNTQGKGQGIAVKITASTAILGAIVQEACCVTSYEANACRLSFPLRVWMLCSRFWFCPSRPYIVNPDGSPHVFDVAEVIAMFIPPADIASRPLSRCD